MNAKSTRYLNFNRAMNSLEESASAPILVKRDLSGVIKDFELAYELAWKALKLFLAEKGHETQSARSVFAMAYQLGYLLEEKVWLDMIQDRNLTVHTYDETFAKEMVDRIKLQYISELSLLKSLFDSKIA
jgi:nucleotidyltransferase substrate binding protein (TIGR01987 family)